MRFTIRDLMWTTVVVALGLGWWVDRRAIEAKNDDAIEAFYAHIETVRDEISNDIKAGRWAEAQMKRDAAVEGGRDFYNKVLRCLHEHPEKRRDFSERAF